ncbi:Uncharacterized protein BM_BM14112 [Brugia malayi]|uniref:Uncharacterized protein n=1 Tax=Brugia malayi TaxID=6279 RepID=A0A4E9FQY3_BRUMA|nr:Uncharacterized protein BM_BM14112 [Brugia malayi]VIO99167.1 Uncharacterized protein BM_BM14112 [Brugia malayi]
MFRQLLPVSYTDVRDLTLEEFGSEMHGISRNGHISSGNREVNVSSIIAISYTDVRDLTLEEFGSEMHGISRNGHISSGNREVNVSSIIAS